MNTIITKNLNIWIDNKAILKDINLTVKQGEITCIIGPSGSGKSTLLRTLNRINADTPTLKSEGNITFLDQNILNKNTDLVALRTQIGMVFQKPCIFPKSIQENVLFGIQLHKKLSKKEKKEIVEENLKLSGLWEEVKDRLNDKSTSLSIGQQQRLCISRTLALKPKVLLLDEPTSALDPKSTRAIEQMMLQLKDSYTIVFVTHNIQQVKRIANHLVFISDGNLIEQGAAKMMFENPQKAETKHYLENS